MPSEFLKSLFESHPDKILAAYIAGRDAWYEGEGDFIERDLLTDKALCHQLSSWSMGSEIICPMDGIVELRALLGCHDGETVREAVERLVHAQRRA